MSINFASLSNWQQQLFAAALLQRMLPNYRLFADACQFGDYELLQNQLDLVWQRLQKLPIKINIEVQLEKLEPQIPQSKKFDVFAVFPAIDVCSGLTCVLQSFSESAINCASELSLLSRSSVASYLELLLASETQEQQKLIDADPLMQWEEEMQQTLYDLVKQSQENKQTCLQVKALVTEQRLTNLAIEY